MFIFKLRYFKIRAPNDEQSNGSIIHDEPLLRHETSFIMYIAFAVALGCTILICCFLYRNFNNGKNAKSGCEKGRMCQYSHDMRSYLYHMDSTLFLALEDSEAFE